MFTKYKFDTVAIFQASAEAAAALAQNMPGQNPAQFAAKVLSERLRKKPALYLEFGPYWWAVKAAMAELGEDFGPSDDRLIRAEYGGTGLPPHAAIVAGEQFKDHYRVTFLAGSSQFWLDDQAEESYVLFDPDMEARILGGNGTALAVALNLTAVTVDDETGPVLDGVAAAPERTPQTTVRLDFGDDGWVAYMQGVNRGDAHEKLWALVGDGVIDSAAKTSSQTGEPVVMQDSVTPIVVDAKRKTVVEIGKINR